MTRAILSVTVLLVGVVGLAGCSADNPINPSFPLTLDDAEVAWIEMCDDPKPFERPVIVLGGIHDTGLAASALARRLRRTTTEDTPVVSISFFTCPDFERCRTRVLDELDQEFPAPDGLGAVEVDVVGVSMGGLVGRYVAQVGHEDGRRLRVRRLFTISTPHDGARMADFPTLDARIRDMRRGSEFLTRLDEASPEDAPTLYPYTRLDDAIVGEDRAAPPDSDPWWVANRPFAMSHLSADRDPRILVDIARRLRDEPPFTSEPRTPVPGSPPP